MDTALQPPGEWSFPKKLFFRFCFLYFTIYIFFTPNNEMPLINKVYEWVTHIMNRFIPWFAKNIMGLKREITVFTGGSGDTTYDYYLWFFGILLAVIGTFIWTLLDRKRKSYNTLVYWLTVFIRYYLIYTMVMYGLVKVIKLQFPFPYLTRLVQPYGDSSPMGLAWTYMGYSDTYNYFTGFGELLAGILLLFRRTATLGAMVCLAVMMNVFMINMSYDVPVKLLSFNTILMCLFLLWKDIRRLVNFFFLNKLTEPGNQSLPFTKRWVSITRIVLKLAFIIFIFGFNLKDAFDAQKQYGDNAPKPPLYGIYNTEIFIRKNDTVPPLQTDTTRWKQLIINWEEWANIKLMNDSLKGYNFIVDSVSKKITVYTMKDTANKYTLVYRQPGKEALVLNGNLWGDSVEIRMKRYDEKNFRLVNRGFHWINEYPYNR